MKKIIQKPSLLDQDIYGLINKIISIATQTVDWLAPRHCLLCQTATGSNQEIICTDCLGSLPLAKNYCPRCGQYSSSNTVNCGNCLTNPCWIDSCHYPLDYSGATKDLITVYKFTPRPQLAPLLAKLIVSEILESTCPLPEGIVAAPMHPQRLRQRGFDHAYLLAKHISRLLDIPLVKGSLEKVRASKTQSSLPRKDRQQNLSGAFACAQNLPFKRLAIVDDVLTTGTTLNEIAKTLKKNGVDYCQAWCLAHTP